MLVRIRMSKTDQEATGVSIAVLWAPSPAPTRSPSPLAGLGDGYSAHSLRAGAATNANGAPISTICKLGRWKENSPVLHAVIGWRSSPS
jgi:hypothetical protein